MAHHVHLFPGMKTEIKEVKLSDGRGSKWIVKVNGQAVRNFWTLAGAEKFAGKVGA